jgi:hypothetical protein
MRQLPRGPAGLQLCAQHDKHLRAVRQHQLSVRGLPEHEPRRVHPVHPRAAGGGGGGEPVHLHPEPGGQMHLHQLQLQAADGGGEGEDPEPATSATQHLNNRFKC